MLALANSTLLLKVSCRLNLPSFEQFRISYVPGCSMGHFGSIRIKCFTQLQREKCWLNLLNSPQTKQMHDLGGITSQLLCLVEIIPCAFRKTKMLQVGARNRYTSWCHHTPSKSLMTSYDYWPMTWIIQFGSNKMPASQHVEMPPNSSWTTQQKYPWWRWWNIVRCRPTPLCKGEVFYAVVR